MPTDNLESFYHQTLPYAKIANAVKIGKFTLIVNKKYCGFLRSMCVGYSNYISS
jgi:hypothetical protein